MKKLTLLLIPVLFMSAVRISGSPEEVQSFCNLALPQTVRVFDWSSWRTAYIRDSNLFYEPFRWDASRSLWRGYGSADAFDQPSDAYKRWSVTLIQDSGAQQWIYILTSRHTPDTDYVYVFQDTRPHADSSGNHYGYHPCRAFAADSSMVNDWIQRAYDPSASSG